MSYFEMKYPLKQTINLHHKHNSTKMLPLLDIFSSRTSVHLCQFQDNHGLPGKTFCNFLLYSNQEHYQIDIFSLVNPNPHMKSTCSI